MKAFITIIAVLAIPVLSFSATYYVPDHFSKIQSAIADATVVNGDVIIVRDGIYHENLDFLGKEITVKSENGPVAAIIDGGGTKPVVRFANGEGAGAVIEGFTLTNGYGEFVPSINGACGGGIVCLNYSCPLIKDNLIVNNYGPYLGGGVGAAGDASGKTCPVIQGNTISNNRSGNSGGGIGGSHSDLVIQNNIIDSNRATYGGGISIHHESNVLIENCSLFNNVATGYYGGAIQIITQATHAEIHNSLIYHNSSWNSGGGINTNAPTSISTTTFFGNQCNNKGGGIAHNCGANELQVTDSIFWANSASPGYEQIGLSGGSATQSVNYCDVQGGYTGTNNIDQDPLFAEGPDGLFYLGQTAAGQSVDSPCLDAGSDTAAKLNMDALWTRTDGVADAGTVDMGYHYGPFPVSRFKADRVLLSESTGGVVNFQLLAGPTQANKQYLIMASVTGTSPGLPLPGWAFMPLNWDTFTSMAITMANTPIFANFLGQLDANGEATATFNTFGPMPAGSAGISLYFAFTVKKFQFVSNVVKVTIVP